MRFVPACFAYLILLRKDSDEEEEKKSKSAIPQKRSLQRQDPGMDFFFFCVFGRGNECTSGHFLYCMQAQRTYKAR